MRSKVGINPEGLCAIPEDWGLTGTGDGMKRWSVAGAKLGANGSDRWAQEEVWADRRCVEGACVEWNSWRIGMLAEWKAG